MVEKSYKTCINWNSNNYVNANYFAGSSNLLLKNNTTINSAELLQMIEWKFQGKRFFYFFRLT